MFKPLFTFFTTDIKWKLGSLVLAFFLWFIAMNINNPVGNHPFDRNLTLLNKEVLSRDDIIILNERTLESTNITVTVRATRNDYNVLNARNDNIRAFVDLRTIDTSQVLQTEGPVFITAYVDVEIIPGYERMTRWPLTVQVELDKRIQQLKPIEIVHYGDVAEGYELQNVTSAYREVIVSGPRTSVEKVHSVRARINVHGAAADVTHIERLHVYDSNNVDITSTVELSVASIEITAGVLPFKSVELVADLSGEPAPGYAYLGDSIQIEPKTVNIVGTEETLEALNRLVLRDIDISYATETVIRAADIRQALEGLSIHLKRGETGEALITVPVEVQLTRDFYYPLESIRVFGYPANQSVQLISSEPVVITVRGVESAMSWLNATLLDVQLDLSRLQLGAHTVPLTISLPYGFSLVGEAPRVEITIQEAASANGNDTTPTDNPPDEQPPEIPIETPPDTPPEPPDETPGDGDGPAEEDNPTDGDTPPDTEIEG